MLKSLRNLIVSLAVVASMAAPVAVTGAVYAAESSNPSASVCEGASNLQINTSVSTSNCATDTTATDKVNSTITTIINVFSTIVGVIAVLMIIWGGLRYITSGGDSGKISSAKNTIIYALIGLVVVALAQFIVKFVLSKVTAD
ncbi:TrbC/VirB2 family protein [Candidatus Saccharibacteria bacterium]|nr:TrbC/VirB2 family protein [Candidatus Saccharibacteria bacterium]